MTNLRVVAGLVTVGFCFFTILFTIQGCTGSKRKGPPSENVIRLPLDSKVRSLDPYITTDVYSTWVQSLVYESLYTYHYLKKPLELIPALAESMPTFSKDRKIMTVKLKKGILFQDDSCFKATQGKGREVVADDIVYMIERNASSKVNSPFYGNFEGKIIGIDDFHAGKAKQISGVKTLDKYTVEIKLAQPLPRFVYNFIDPHTALIPKECVEILGDDFSRHPVGTGPYRIIQADLSSKIVAVRNPNYRTVTYPTEGNPGDREKGMLENAGKQLPLTDKVVFEVLIEKQPQWLKFLAGDFESVIVPKDNVGTALPGGKLSPDLEKLGIKYLRQARSDVTVTIFNMEDPVWGKKKELRHAFQLARDVPKIIELQYSGQAIQAHSMIDPTQYGYDPEFKSKWATRNLKKAKELLAQAGYPDGKGLPPLIMPINDGTTARHLDELLKRQLGEVGITINSEPMTWPEFDKRARTKNFTVMGMGYSSNVPDMDDMTNLLLSTNAAPGPNLASYKNPEVDKLIKEIEAMDNGAARLSKIRRLRDILDDDLPYAVVVHRIGNQLYQPWVKNAVFMDQSFVGMFIRYLDIETAPEKK